MGEKDARVPLPQSVELYRALKSNGLPTRLYVASREGHGWEELRHRLFKMNVELEWFAGHALRKEYTWEEAPQGSPQDSGEGSGQTVKPVRFRSGADRTPAPAR